MITCIRTKSRDPEPVIDRDVRCLLVRRDVFPDGSYEEYSYFGPEAEVMAMAERFGDVDIEKVEDLLRKGKTVDEALKELGR